MWNEIANWWRVLWTEQKPAATAIAGFVAAFAMFLIKDAIWQRRVSRLEKREQLQQKQLDNFYSPLYRFYRESYARFDYWRAKNPETTLERQPFFEPQSGETLAENIFAEHSTYASQTLITLWSEFKATDDKVEKIRRRQLLLNTLIKEYQTLRKGLSLDYDKSELSTGEFERVKAG
jgi:hypothetical protein